jgi:hypothetical protein
MTLAKQKTVKILKVALILIIAAVPIWSFAVTGYVAVSDSQLTIEVLTHFAPIQMETLEIVANVNRGGFVIEGKIMNPTFTLTVAGVVVAHLVCPDGPMSNGYRCTIFKVAASRYALETNLVLTMEAVLRFGLYQAAITRVASSLLSQPWLPLPEPS